MIDYFLTCFDTFDSEYKRLQVFERSNYYIEPQLKIIGSSADVSRKNNETSMVLKHTCCMFVPVSETLKRFLSLPGVLACIEKHTNDTYISKTINKNDFIYKKYFKW